MNQPLHRPLLTPAQASALLDQVVYEQVLECIDLDALYRLEQSLALLVRDIDGVPGDQICALATAMMDRALLRLPADLRRYLGAAAWPRTGCELCDDEPRAGSPAAIEQPPGQAKL